MEKTEFSTSEAAKLLNVSFRTIQRWIASGKLTVTKNDRGRNRVDLKEIVRLNERGKDEFKDTIINLLDRKKVAFLREIQISLESDYTHTDTSKKLTELQQKKNIKTTFYQNYRWYYLSGTNWSDLEKIADHKIESEQIIINHPKRFEKDNIVYLDYSEYLVEKALLRAGYTIMARDTYYFNGLVYRNNGGAGRPTDLDFIAKVPDREIYVGIQVKNRTEAPKREVIENLLELTHALHLRPILVSRIVHPAHFLPILNSKGRIIAFKRLFLQPDFPREKFKEIIDDLGIPIGVYKWSPDFLTKAFSKAAKAMKE